MCKAMCAYPHTHKHALIIRGKGTVDSWGFQEGTWETECYLCLDFTSFAWQGGASWAKERAQQQFRGLTRHVMVLVPGVGRMVACGFAVMGPINHAEEFGEPRTRQGCERARVFPCHSGCSMERAGEDLVPAKPVLCLAEWTSTELTGAWVWTAQ